MNHPLFGSIIFHRYFEFLFRIFPIYNQTTILHIWNITEYKLILVIIYAILFRSVWLQLISIFIGHNDFCTEICAVPSPWSIVENHKIQLVETLRILRDNLPRTFIAIQLPPHLKVLVASRKGRNSLKCYVTTMIECSCLFALQFQDWRQEYYKVIARYDLNSKN